MDFNFGKFILSSVLHDFVNFESCL